VKAKIISNEGRVIIGLSYGSGLETVATARVGATTHQVREALRGITWHGREPNARALNRALAREALDRAGLLDHRQRPRAKEPRSAPVTVKLRPVERAAGNAPAGAAVLPLSEYLRRLVEADMAARSAEELKRRRAM